MQFLSEFQFKLLDDCDRWAVSRAYTSLAKLVSSYEDPILVIIRCKLKSLCSFLAKILIPLHINPWQEAQNASLGTLEDPTALDKTVDNWFSSQSLN